MFTNTFIKTITAKFFIGALLVAGFITWVPSPTASAQKRKANVQKQADFPEVKDVTPDSKGCFVREGKKYCFKPEGQASNKLKAAPTDPQALKDCFWHVDKNGKKRLACIYYAF